MESCTQSSPTGCSLGRLRSTSHVSWGVTRSMPSVALEVSAASPTNGRVVWRSTERRKGVAHVPSAFQASSASTMAAYGRRCAGRRRSFRSSVHSSDGRVPVTGSGRATRLAAGLSKACYILPTAAGSRVNPELLMPGHASAQTDICCNSDAWSTDVESETELFSETSGISKAASCPRDHGFSIRNLSLSRDVNTEHWGSATANLEKGQMEETIIGPYAELGDNDGPSEVIPRSDSLNCPFKALCRIGSKIRDVALKRRDRSASISHSLMPDGLGCGGLRSSGSKRSESVDGTCSERVATRVSPWRRSLFCSAHGDHEPGSRPSGKASPYPSNGVDSPITPTASRTPLLSEPASPRIAANMPLSLPDPDKSGSPRSPTCVEGISVNVSPELKAQYLRKFIAHEMMTKECNYAEHLDELAEVFRHPLAEASARAAAAVVRRHSRIPSVSCTRDCASRCSCKYLRASSPASPESLASSRASPGASPPRLQSADSRASPAICPGSGESGRKNPKAMPEWVDELRATSTVLAGDLKKVCRHWIPEKSGIGEVFLKNLQADRFTVYLRYCRDYQSVIDSVGRMSKSSFTLKNMDGNSKNNRLALKSFLILPIQQLGRYPLWLHDLVKATPDDHLDYPGLVEAERQMRELASIANSWVDDG